MTSWNLTQMAEAGRLSAAAGIDPSHPDLDRATQHAREQIRDALIRDGARLGLEIHPDDVEVRITSGQVPWMTHIAARWVPRTREIELVGGAKDGMVLNYRLAPGPLEFQIQHPGPPLGDAAHQTRMWECFGWNPTSRRWVYQERAPRPQPDQHEARRE